VTDTRHVGKSAPVSPQAICARCRVLHTFVAAASVLDVCHSAARAVAFHSHWLRVE
jgi:hypothetical protein